MENGKPIHRIDFSYLLHSQFPTIKVRVVIISLFKSQAGVNCSYIFDVFHCNLFTTSISTKQENSKSSLLREHLHLRIDSHECCKMFAFSIFSWLDTMLMKPFERISVYTILSSWIHSFSWKFNLLELKFVIKCSIENFISKITGVDDCDCRQVKSKRNVESAKTETALDSRQRSGIFSIWRITWNIKKTISISLCSLLILLLCNILREIAMEKSRKRIEIRDRHQIKGRDELEEFLCWMLNSTLKRLPAKATMMIHISHDYKMMVFFYLISLVMLVMWLDVGWEEFFPLEQKKIENGWNSLIQCMESEWRKLNIDRKIELKLKRPENCGKKREL